jgi:hypothetical protein
VIQLNRLNWRDYIRQPNPVAAALMTKMRIAPEDRPRVKLEFLRMVATLRLNKARSELLRNFMTRYLKLTAQEQTMYNSEYERLDPAEKEAIVEAIDEWDAAGIAKGVRRGIAISAVRLLSNKFGLLPEVLINRIHDLPEPVLDNLLDAILNLKDLQEVENWLAQNPSPS